MPTNPFTDFTPESKTMAIGDFIRAEDPEINTKGDFKVAEDTEWVKSTAKVIHFVDDDFQPKPIGHIVSREELSK
jgi:hypothetical protein